MTTKQIDAVLDKARAKFGAEAWDDNSVQDDVLNLVTEEVDE